MLFPFFFEDKPTKIYIDTNILECYHDKDTLFLDSFRLNGNLFKLITYVKEKGWQEQVLICIPKIVIEEMKEHFVKCFKCENEKLKQDIEKHKRTFGELLEIDYTLKKVDIEQYEAYISQCLEDATVMNVGSFTIIEYPDCFPVMINKAIKTIKPFALANGNKKKYSDAGFKDALVLESMLSHCDLENENIILFSADNDFKETIGHKNFQTFSTLEIIIQALDEIYKADPLSEVKKQLEGVYHREMLLSSVGCILDDSVKDFGIDNIEKIEADEYKVEQTCTVNEAKYNFNYIFDAVANEIISIESKITNE